MAGILNGQRTNVARALKNRECFRINSAVYQTQLKPRVDFAKCPCQFRRNIGLARTEPFQRCIGPQPLDCFDRDFRREGNRLQPTSEMNSPSLRRPGLDVYVRLV